jgi:ATP-binding cassette subfamily B protein
VLAPPLLIRAIFDDAIPNKDDQQVTVLAGLMIVIAFAVAVIGMVERYLSATIGEGLIYDLRSALFDHVQRQPIAFFTRTQTGALVSRMNNDVIGAQRAVTGTLGTVVSNSSWPPPFGDAYLEWRSPFCPSWSFRCHPGQGGGAPDLTRSRWT